MKRTSALAMVFLFFLAVGVMAGQSKSTTTKLVNQSAFGGDSIGLPADTTDALQMYQPGMKGEYKVSAASLDSVTFMVQISPDNSTWYNYTVLDTLPEGIVHQKTTADMFADYPKWWTRVIFNTIEAETLTSARSYLQYYESN